MTNSFKALSLTYKKAPLAIRELLALNELECEQVQRSLQQELGLSDLLVLSTCNRTEVYYTAEDDQQIAIIDALGHTKGCASSRGYASYFEHFTTAGAAAQHLFEVALGLDAQVVGDLQVINQVKLAYRRSVAAAAAGPFLHRLLHAVLAANKRVQQETAFRDGAASTSSATLELVEALTADLPSPRVLVVGLGEIGADVARHFAKSRRFTHVTLCNRTRVRAEALAAVRGLKVLEFADLADGVRQADVIISSVSAPVPLFTRELVAGLEVLSPKFFIDLSVPRSVDPAAEHVPGVLVYNIDAIQHQASAALSRRLAAVPQVWAIIAESVAGLRERSRELHVSPAIQQLKNTLEQLRQQELARFQKKASPAEARRLDQATQALTQKFLKLPVLQLKAACQRGEADELVAALTELFVLKA
ncbi:glutamyl-tRNA reductase [Hymenobacter endophyticus]|uniref:Glutamyl-tRNA reductase n=1 Tax=Hymenobacter endophyticus TaxID=3076335 RepID=A0ABU3TKX7_9BACT|nr:glutamyl-tRNA reductase [Hymenobacter endophyticus]MDU0372032.1 glutamyl-tRNA reductase [Hymenobacter endophyticus]